MALLTRDQLGMNGFSMGAFKNFFPAAMMFSANNSSPIVDWLKALCNEVRESRNAVGVGVIGMCLTGNFAISLMANEDVLAGFSSQPSLPLFKQDALHMSPEEIEKIKNNLDKVGPMHCGHFEKDGLCTPQKMDLIDRTFNHDDKERIIFHKLPGKGHAIITIDFVDEEGNPTHQTLQEIFTYFDHQLN